MSDQGQAMPMLSPNMAAMMGSNVGNAASAIRFLPNGAPIISNMADMTNFANQQWDNWEFVTQTLYDSAVYLAAGQASLQFFQVPQGAGVGFGGGAKSLSDTNMVLNGQLPTGQMFIVSTVEIEFQPATPTVAAGMPSFFGAQLAQTSINDAYIFWRAGNITLRILQKDYLQEAPLMRLPSQADFSIQAAMSDATTAAAASQSRVGFASSYGPVYSLAPNNLLIPQTTNFLARMAWPEGVQAITNPARVFVRFGGMQARQAQ